MQSSTVVAALNEAELKRQRDRQKMKDRKKRRSSGKQSGKQSASTTAAAATTNEQSTDDFIAFSQFGDDESQAMMNGIDVHQQQLVDQDQQEEKEKEEEAQRVQQEEENPDEAMVDADHVEEEEEVDPTLDLDENEEEELLPSEDEEEDEANGSVEADADEDEIAVDLMDPNLSDDEVHEDSLQPDENDENVSSPHSPAPSPTTSHTTMAYPTSSKKRSFLPSDSLTTAPSIRLSTFGFTSDQVEYDAAKHEYLLKFRANECLTFHGSVTFAVEEGYIEVHGHTFNPRSKRQRFSSRTGTFITTSSFNIHSWQWQPHALLSLTAKSSAASSLDEFVAIVRLKACESRFSPHKLAAIQNGEGELIAQPPTALSTSPYEASTLPSAIASTSTDSRTTPAKPTASSKKNKRQKRDATEVVNTPTSSTATSASSIRFVRVNIPGFTPVLFSDDDFKSASSATTSSSTVPPPRFIYGTLHIPSEWKSSIQSIVQPQVSSTTNQSLDEDAEEGAPELTKAQLLARKVHLKTLRQHIATAGLRILVYGNRNSGKSTLLRFLINHALNRFQKVLYLDLDVGQSTLNPPGMIGLHEIDVPILSTSSHVLTSRSAFPSSASAASSKMIWSFFVGDVTQNHDPTIILHATAAAIRQYEQRYGPNSGHTSFAPLLVNTQGWLTGLGLDLLQTTVKEIVKPVYLIEVKVEKEEEIEKNTSASGHKKRKQLDDDGDDESHVLGEIAHPHQLYIFRRTIDSSFSTSLVSSNSIASAPRLRQLQLLSYFTAGSLASSLPFTLAAYASIISSLTPYRLPFGRVAVELIGMDPQRDYDVNSILVILNTSIVGLCIRSTHDHRKEFVAKKSGLRILAERVATPIFQDSTSTPIDVCVGLGIIRGIDLAEKCFLLLTPLQLDQLAAVNLVQKGKLDLPNMAFGLDDYSSMVQVKDGHSSTNFVRPHSLPYLSSNCLSAGSGVGSREMSSRHNIQRKRLQ